MNFKGKNLLWVTMIFLTAISLKINAQNGPGGGMREMPSATVNFKSFDPEERIEEETRWMKKRLKLSNDQMVKVTRISEKYAYAQAELMPKPGERPSMGNRSEGRNEGRSQGGRNGVHIETKMKQLMAEKDAEMQIVLSDKQFQKYKKNRTDLSKEIQGSSAGGRGRPAGGPPQGDRPSF